MPGQREPQVGPDFQGQHDLLDATVDLSRLIDRVRPETSSQTNGNGASHASWSPLDGPAPIPADQPDPTPTPAEQADLPPSPADRPDLASGAADQPDPAPTPTDQQALASGGADQPTRGSRADLRHRLERLPLGHPSSPFHSDGEAKPPPPRLRHLELAPPSRNLRTDSPTSPYPDRSAGGSAGSTPRSETDGSWKGGPVALTQIEVRIAEDMYDRFRAAEGRNLFGSYGESGLTPAVRRVEAGLEHGRLAPGTETDALLETHAFKARLADLIRRHPDRSADQLARRFFGALSYTFIFDAEQYSAGTWRVQQALQAQGFELRARRNSWTRAEDKRVITMWHDPATDLAFQVLFHTTASFEAQQLARTSAALIGDPRIPAAEADNLRADLATAWAALPPPPGNDQIDDYRPGLTSITMTNQSAPPPLYRE